MVDLLLASGTAEKRMFVLEKPRLALEQAAGIVASSWDPQLSPAGNRIHKQLGCLLEQLNRAGELPVGKDRHDFCCREDDLPDAGKTTWTHTAVQSILKQAALE